MYVTNRFPPPGVNELHREMDRLFENFFGPSPPPAAAAGAYPALNLWEDGERIYAEAEVPGLKLEALELLIQGNELTIKGRRDANAGDGVSHLRRERGVGEFMRFISLPAEVDGDRAEAALTDGVLRIVMPKAEKAKARRIVVKPN